MGGAELDPWNIAELISRQAELRPDTPAIIEGDPNAQLSRPRLADPPDG
jgi:hypothetical protein